MKFILTIMLLSRSFYCFCQKKDNKIVGKYNDSFGCSLEIKKDSTFYFTWHFDLYSSWNKGTWRIHNDTIFLKKVIVYDTLFLKNDSSTLVVSDDPIANKIYKDYNLTFPNLSGGQDHHPVPDKLIIDHRRLYVFKNGEVIRKKVRGFSNKKKVPSWYVKEG